MAEDILHEELGEGDKVIITHEGDEEELSFEVHKGEAEIADPDEDEFSDTDGQANGSTETAADGGVAEPGASGGTAAATDSDE